MLCNERFHHEIIRIKKHMINMKKTQQIIYNRNIELNLNKSLLVFIFSVFDVILTRSSDFAHFEYNDITKLLHILLMTTILTSQIQKEYSDILRDFVYSFD